MSDTPRTDAEVFEAEWQTPNRYRVETVNRECVEADFARQLERELAEAQRDAARYRWLRDHAESIKYSGCHVVRATAHCLDASVDIAMKGQP